MCIALEILLLLYRFSGAQKSGILHLQKSLKLYQFFASSNSTLHLHTHTHLPHTQTHALTFHVSLSVTSVLFMFSLLSSPLSSALQAHLSHPSPSHELSAGDITLTLPHCPTYKWREGAGEEGDGVDRGEDEADGSRGSINSLSS